MGGYQNYGSFLVTLNIKVPYYNRDPKKDHNFDDHPFRVLGLRVRASRGLEGFSAQGPQMLPVLSWLSFPAWAGFCSDVEKCSTIVLSVGVWCSLTGPS